MRCFICLKTEKCVNNLLMRKSGISIDEVKEKVAALKGVKLKVAVNHGRKRIVKYEGEISATYPSVFTMKIDDNKNVKNLTFSYSDVICGDIKFSYA
ncbi:MAG: Veg family protein [Firmicutes bacterium]|nr:Veg family protein [Bacillota bacterium]